MYDFEKAVDLTHHLRTGMPVYPGDPSPSFENYATLERDGVNLTRLVMGSHTGTHIDAPRHFLADGIGIDQIPVSRLVSEAFVIDFSGKPIGSGLSADDFRKSEKFIQPGKIIACYTGCSDHWEDESVRKNYTYLTPDAGKFLVSKKVGAVGIDFLSVEKFGDSDHMTHKTLLGNGILIIESLSRNLKQFVGRRILMISLPIKLENGDGAPARVLAIPVRN